LGRWRPNGTIEYLGRNDYQIKIRGFRIELGEIEAQLTAHMQVKEAVAVARDDSPGGKRLVAYVVPRNSDDAGSGLVERLRAHLQQVLPDYMVPSALVVIDRMPMTLNGKLDRNALPPPDSSAYVSREYVSPQGEVEECVADVWRELLRVDRIGRLDNFFELGGHSLLAMQASARLESRWPIDVPIRSIFDYPSLSDLAAHIEELRSSLLLDRIAAGGDEIEDLVETLASIPEGRARELLRNSGVEGRP